MLAVKLLLRVDEAADILRVSERYVRELVEEGKLDRHPLPPLRITTESVKRYLAACRQDEKSIP